MKDSLRPIAAFAGAVMVFGGWAQSNLVPIPLSLPKPLFEGTPANLKVPNLEKPLGKPRPQCLAPAGTTNLARGQPAPRSTAEPAVGELDMSTDGNKAGIDGTFVDLGTG